MERGVRRFIREIGWRRYGGANPTRFGWPGCWLVGGSTSRMARLRSVAKVVTASLRGIAIKKDIHKPNANPWEIELCQMRFISSAELQYEGRAQKIAGEKSLDELRGTRFSDSAPGVSDAGGRD